MAGRKMRTRARPAGAKEMYKREREPGWALYGQRLKTGDPLSTLGRLLFTRVPHQKMEEPKESMGSLSRPDETTHSIYIG